MRTKDQVFLAEAYQRVCEMAFGIAGAAGGQRRITKEQLADVIREAEAAHRGTNFFSFTQITRENTRKGPNPIFVLTGLKTNKGRTSFAKVTQLNVQTNLDYGRQKERKMAELGTPGEFTPEPSKYNSTEGSNVIVELEGNLYLKYFPKSVSKNFAPVFVQARAGAENPQTADDFEVVPRETVNQYKTERPPQAGDVAIRHVSMDGIAAARINGQEYVVTDLDPVRKAIYEASGAPVPLPDPEENQAPVEPPVQ